MNRRSEVLFFLTGCTMPKLNSPWSGGGGVRSLREACAAKPEISRVMSPSRDGLKNSPGGFALSRELPVAL